MGSVLDGLEISFVKVVAAHNWAYGDWAVIGFSNSEVK